MPVSASTADIGCLGQVTCEQLRVLNPDVTLVEGRESTQRLLAVELVQSQVVTLRWIMRDGNGYAIDLSTCGDVTAQLRVKEALASLSQSPIIDIAGTVEDEANGIIEASLTSTHTAEPGIYIGEWAVFDGSDNLLFSNTFYLVINPGLYGTGTKTGAPRLSEIRLHLRTSSDVDSTLLEQREWDAAELAYAITRPVMYWNESNPPIDLNYTTQTFPYRFNWLEAIVGELMLMAATSYRRDHLPYSAAGVSVDDKNKWQQYEAEGYRKRQIFEAFVLKKKASINMEAGWGNFVSDYSF